MDHSDWKLDNMTSFYTDDNTPWDDVIASINGDYSADEQNSLQINIELSRNTKVFEKLFYGPLIRNILCLNKNDRINILEI